MKDKSMIFLVLSVLSGGVGFSGINFFGIEVVRILFLIFVDLMVISLLAKLFFPGPKLKLKRIK